MKPINKKLLKLIILEFLVYTTPSALLLYWYFEYGSKMPDGLHLIGYFIMFFTSGLTLFLGSKIQQKIHHIKENEYYRPHLRKK